MAIDEHIESEAKMVPRLQWHWACKSRSARPKMGRHRVSLLDGSSSGHGDECDYKLMIMRPQSVENGQEEHHLGSPYKYGPKKTSPDINITYHRRRGRPAGSKSTERNMEQKRALFDSSSGRKSDNDDDLDPSDEDDDFEPNDNDGDFEPNDEDADFEPTRKRGRPAGTKYAKSKKPRLVHSSSSSSSDGKKDKDGDFEPEVSQAHGVKKYARVKDLYGTAWGRAVEVNENLPAEGPSFVKVMLKSHVVRGFWLGIPTSFCRNHLPEHDVTIELEDEDGQICDTNYIPHRKALSGGWRWFVLQQDLKLGDAVVFQLVRPTRFKVYILRENKFSTADGALGILGLDTSKEGNTSEGYGSDHDVDGKSKKDPEATRDSSKASEDDDTNNLGSEEGADGGISSPDPDTDFNTVKSLRDFKIIVDGSVIRRKLLPARVRRSYYKLCCDRKAFLHRDLLKGINPTLAAMVIMETVTIAEGIRACPDSSTSLDHLAAWKKTVESFQLLGMDVAFLGKRVGDLLALLAAQSSTGDLLLGVEECESYKKMKLKRDVAAKKIRALEAKMSSLTGGMKEMDIAMKEMVESSAMKKKEMDMAMRLLAAAPW